MPTSSMLGAFFFDLFCVDINLMFKRCVFVCGPQSPSHPPALFVACARKKSATAPSSCGRAVRITSRAGATRRSAATIPPRCRRVSAVTPCELHGQTCARFFVRFFFRALYSYPTVSFCIFLILLLFSWGCLCLSGWPSSLNMLTLFFDAPRDI